MTTEKEKIKHVALPPNIHKALLAYKKQTNGVPIQNIVETALREYLLSLPDAEFDNILNAEVVQ